MIEPRSLGNLQAKLQQIGKVNAGDEIILVTPDGKQFNVTGMRREQPIPSTPGFIYIALEPRP